jgi:hypothetical protein
MPNHHISCHRQLCSAICQYGSLQRKATSCSIIHLSKARVSNHRSATATLLQLADTSADDHPSHQHTLLLKYFTMLFTYNHIAIIAGISIFANALPLDTKPRDLVPRQKNYSVINVDGGSSEAAQATTVIKPTETVQVVNPGPTITQEVTTVVSAVPAPTPTSSSSKSTSCVSSSITSTSLSTSTSTPAPSSISQSQYQTMTDPLSTMTTDSGTRAIASSLSKLLSQLQPLQRRVRLTQALLSGPC